MKLSDLPPEVLKDILNGAFLSSAVLELWKTGDRILMFKLVNYGVTDIDLRDSDSDSTSRWPRCLTQFKLKRFSILREDSPLYPLPSLRKALQQLPPGLKLLRIYTEGVLELFLPFESTATPKAWDSDDEEGDTPPSPKRPKYQELDSVTTYEPHIPLNQLWPCLEHLELGPHSDSSHYKIGTPIGVLGASALSLLPRTLTYLGLPCSILRPSLELIPPLLKTLRVRRNSLTTRDLSQLPKTITNLHRCVSKEALLHIHRNPMLLPKLKIPRIAEDCSSFIAHVVRKRMTWPDTCVELDLNHLPARTSVSLEALPSSLTYLAYSNSPVLGYDEILLLPRGLTYLCVSAVKWDRIFVSTWPSTLATLIVGRGEFDMDCFQLLPRSLTACSIASECSFCNFSHEALCEIGRQSLASDAHWPPIKLDLLRFKHEDPTKVPLEALEAYIESIESGRLFGLPLTLKSLQLPDFFLMHPLKPLLPLRLANITHRQANHPSNGSNFWPLLLEALPPTTAGHLDITLSATNEKKFRSLETLIPPTSCALQSSRLVFLKLAGEFRVTETLFQNLPRTLRTLEIFIYYHHGGFEPQVLQFLPDLTSLIVGNSLLNDGLAPWVHYLPRTIETLHTPSMAIMGCHIKDMPPKISSLETSFFEVSLPQVLDLPRRLVSLRVNRCGGFQSTLRRHCLTLKAWSELVRTYRPFWRIWEAGLHAMTIELSIMAQKPLLDENTYNELEFGTFHFGAYDFSRSFANMPMDSNLLNYERDTSQDEKYDYISATVEHHLEQSADSVSIDPRTTRRINTCKSVIQ